MYTSCSLERKIMRYATPDESRAAGIAYHMVPVEEWQAKRGQDSYTPHAFDADGFIHTTNGLDELVAVGNRYYRNDPRDYMALVLDVANIVSPVRYDDPDQVFPHIYGPLNPSAVIGTLVAVRDEDGTFRAFADA
jgi:uncharacterized protein (DUF952 family)